MNKDRKVFRFRCDRFTPEILKEIALKEGFTYNKEGSTGQLLDAIARGEYKIVRTENITKCWTLLEKMMYNSKCEDKNPRTNLHN